MFSDGPLRRFYANLKRHEAVLFLSAFYLVILIGGMAGNAIGALIVKILPEKYQTPPADRQAEQHSSSHNAQDDASDTHVDTHNTQHNDIAGKTKKQL